MKITSLVIFGITLLFGIQIAAQDSFGRRYFIEDKVYNDKIPLQVEKFIKYNDLEDKSAIDLKLKLLSDGLSEYLKFADSKGNEVVVTKEIIDDASKLKILKETIGMKVPVVPDFIENGGYKEFKGNVLFEKDKLYVNIWNYITKNKVDTDNIPKNKVTGQPFEDDKKENYYKLIDGQTVKLKFCERTLTSLTIPLKYRFGNEEELSSNGMPITNTIDETFSTDFNLAFFYGWSTGNTRFNRRVKVKNKTITNKHSFGFIVGTGAEKLSLANTDGTKIEADIKDKMIGFLTLGGGYVRTLNKFGFGVFAGWDIGVGEISKTWDYDKRLWVGVGIGYDLFKFQPE